MKSKLTLTAVLLLVFGLGAFAAPPDKTDVKKLKQELGQAIQAGNWDAVGEKIKALGDADDPKLWSVMVKVVEKSPPEEQLELALADAASKMKSPSSLKAIEKTALKSRHSRIRRVLVSSLARLENWKGLIGALKDKDEQVAAMAAWALIDNKVADGVQPMIDLLGKLEGKKDGIWDVLNKGLGQLLGQKCNSAVEYLSRWEHVQSSGGLASVEPLKPSHKGGEGGGTMVRVKLFGSEIDCTRVVFILDVSGSMKQVDDDQQTYDGDEDSKTKTRKGKEVGPSQGGEAVDPNLKTRLERAQRQLRHVIEKLPANFKINIIAYSSRVQIWPASMKGTGNGTPELLPLTPANRKAAIEFVDSFKASGVTATDTALRRAYEVDGARCFYLLSDGRATHDGSGTDVPTQVMLDVLEEFKAKHVTVHTLGFKGADVEMMKSVAEKGAGTYTDIK